MEAKMPAEHFIYINQEDRIAKDGRPPSLFYQTRHKARKACKSRIIQI